MNALRSAVAAAALTAVALPAGAVTTFDFFWSGDPAADSTIQSSADPTTRAEGTIVIDALPGATFTLANILSTSITVIGSSFSDFTFSSWSSAGGTVAADGLSASFSTAGNPYIFDDEYFFGCLEISCGDSVVRARGGANGVNVLYTSSAAALASMQMTARQVEVIPLPGTLPLLLGAIGLFAAVRRRAA